MRDLPSRLAGAPITTGVDPSPGWDHLMGRDRVMCEMVEAGLPATELRPKADADLSVRFHETVAAEVVRFPAPNAGEERAPHRGSTEEGAAPAALHRQRKEH
jgi:hypothetical protein